MQVASPPAPAPPAVTTPAAAAAERVFAAPAGLVFNSIKLDQVKNFEMILGRLKEALVKSPDPIRQQQAAGWKIFKATEAGPGGSVLFVFVMDPAVKGGDYGVAKILAEVFPMEAQELYRIYINAFGSGQTLLNLTPAPAATPVTAGPESRTRPTGQ